MARSTAKGIRIRRATLRDLDVLVRHRRGMWRDISDRTEAELDAADPVYRRWARQRIQSGGLVGFVAETSDGTAVASGVVWVRRQQPMPTWADGAVPYLLSMYTEPEHRGRGLATRIVREAVRWAKERGYRVMTLHASRFGRRLYRDVGFERTWEMRIRLRPPTRTSARARARRRAPRSRSRR